MLDREGRKAPEFSSITTGCGVIKWERHGGDQEREGCRFYWERGEQRRLPSSSGIGRGSKDKEHFSMAKSREELPVEKTPQKMTQTEELSALRTARPHPPDDLDNDPRPTLWDLVQV